MELAISFDADTNVKEREGHTPLLLTVDKGRRTAVEALVNAGASIIVLEGSGITLLQVAASSQNSCKARLQYIRHYGGSLAKTGRRGIHQFPVHITDDPRQTGLKHSSHWIDNTVDPLINLARFPLYRSSP